MLEVFEERIRSQDEELPRDLDELAREGARRMLAEEPGRLDWLAGVLSKECLDCGRPLL